MSARMAKRVTLRVGELGDLATLGDIDADASTLFEDAGMFLDLPEDPNFQRPDAVAGRSVSPANPLSSPSTAPSVLSGSPPLGEKMVAPTWRRFRCVGISWASASAELCWKRRPSSLVHLVRR